MTAYVYGYCRASTGGQDVGIQRDALLKAGVPEENIVEEYGSGAKRDRAGLKDVLSRLREGDTLVVWKLDRLARSLSHLIFVVEGLEKRGVNFISLTENFDTKTPAGRAFFQMCGVMGELERNLIEERRNAGIAKARAAGKRFGRKPASDPTATRRAKDGSIIPDDKSGRLAKAILAVQNGASIRGSAKANRIGEATLHRHLKVISEREFTEGNSELFSARKVYQNGRDSVGSPIRSS